MAHPPTNRTIRLHRSTVSLIVKAWVFAQSRDDIPSSVRYEMPALVAILDTRRADHQIHYSNFIDIEASLSAWRALVEFCRLVGSDSLTAVGNVVDAETPT